MPHRWMFMLSSVLAALVIAAMPVTALATDDCDDDDCDDEPPAAVVTPAPPVPAPAPVQSLTTVPSPAAVAPPVQQVRGERITAPKKTTRAAKKHTRKTKHTQTTAKRVVRVRTAAVSLQTVPRGGVQAGAGSTAPAGPDELVFVLAGGSLLLLTAGGGLLARARREDR